MLKKVLISIIGLIVIMTLLFNVLFFSIDENKITKIVIEIPVYQNEAKEEIVKKEIDNKEEIKKILYLMNGSMLIFGEPSCPFEIKINMLANKNNNKIDFASDICGTFKYRNIYYAVSEKNREKIYEIINKYKDK